MQLKSFAHAFVLIAAGYQAVDAAPAAAGLKIGHHTTIIHGKMTTLGHHHKTKTGPTKTHAPVGPAPTSAPPPPANPSVPASCHLTKYSKSAVAAAVSSCSNIILDGLQVTGGETLDLSKLKAGANVLFRGTTTFEHANWQGPLVVVSGSDITVDGTGATLDGQGALYWDGKGSNGGVTKPKFFALHYATRAKVTNVRLLNSPVQAFSINGCTDCQIINPTHDNAAGDNAGGHNTDSMDIGASSNVIVSGAKFHSQDDCVAVNSGVGITFTGGSCIGGHGLSIGSVGKADSTAKNTVKNVVFADSTVANSQNGLRIKTIAGGTGSVSGITYRNIKLNNISNFGITIQQDYRNGGPTGKPTTGVPISGVLLENVSGDVTSGAAQVNVLCGSSTSCSGFAFKNVALTGGAPKENCSKFVSVCAAL
ncbi:hypothetical protein HDU87_006331 [Geranomyces variabilis]|uniref:endo-polygalacturonase n=1 Tax=Geranomyces variabilis TaxID=109894 RepID=A0AAD5XQL3_9FUNG|nr:hypothetical protein HDU87_006331 [Geranomyces variabilis]